MFKHQDTVLKDWKVVDRDVPPDEIDEVQDTALSKDTYYDGRVVSAEPSAGDEATDAQGFEIAMPSTQNSIDDDGQWNEDETEDESFDRCSNCGAVMPAFAMAAHEQYHKSIE
jgi:DNA polymerase iota